MNGAVLFLFSLFVFYCNDSVVAYVAYLIDGSRMPYKKVFLLQIPAVFIQIAVTIFWIIVPDSPNIIIHSILLILWRVTELLIMASWVFFLFRKTEIKKRFFYAFMIFPFYSIASYSAYYLIDLVMPDNQGFLAQYIVWTPRIFFIYCGLFALTHAGVALAIRFVSKTSFWGKLQAFGSYPRLFIPIGAISYLSYSLFAHFGSDLVSAKGVIIGINISSIVLLAIVVLIVSDIKRTEKLVSAQNLLLQQQSYIAKLESIQQEIRGIQHDYKNMLAGLYAQASEGNALAVKEYIDTKLLNVDETVREDLRQMNQLTLIEIPELKGLIMTKMLEAERDKTYFRLEVMFPISQVSMAVEDLLRCAGILLDNAIEEARKQEDAAVTLLLLQEDKALTVVVKNTVRDKPDLSQIWNEGYSTKGKGRGVGLSNYQNIVRKYPNATQETKIDGEYFVQALVIAGKR